MKAIQRKFAQGCRLLADHLDYRTRDVIYVVTTVTFSTENAFGEERIGKRRTISWYRAFEEAERSVLENHNHWVESLYTHAIIETSREGMYGSTAGDPVWYVVSTRNLDGTYEIALIDTPASQRQCVGYGVG